ncbi:MAG: hypothetical protein Q8929_00150, partial [Bacillota bacterium]|nr:hypothetical protein [Bacillota bacterium]
MFSTCFFKNVARLVLFSYSLQLVSPAYGGKAKPELGLELESQSHWQPIHMPKAEAQKAAQQIIDDYEQGKQSSVFSQSEAFRYRLGIKAIHGEQDKVQLKFSRKGKGSAGGFETLHKEYIHSEKVDCDLNTKEADQDALLTLFKGSSAYKHDESRKAIIIPGFGRLLVQSNGSVIFDKDHTTSLLSCYDLTLKSSGKLNIDSLAVANLTLDAKKSKILGIVTTHDLCMNSDVMNLMGVRAHTLTGTGTFINQGRLDLEGTAENPAVLGVHKLINEKNKNSRFDPKIESSHLRITATNKSFVNAEDADFAVTQKLVVDESEGATLLNKGRMTLRNGEVHRSFTNEVDGELNVLDQLIDTGHFLNRGDVDVKNLLKTKWCGNTGTIQGRGLTLDIEKEMINEGQVALRKLAGKGFFKNYRGLEFQGQDGIISIYDFQNETLSKKKPATVKGRVITLSSANKSFVNYRDSDILCRELRPDRAENDYFTQFVENSGLMKIGSLSTKGWAFENLGTIETTSLAISKGKSKGKFTNLKEGKVKVLGAITIEDCEFINNGDVALNHLSGPGKFINHKNIQFTGKEGSPSQITIMEFENGQNNPLHYLRPFSPATISGNHLIIGTPAKGKFVTHDNSHITAKSLLFPKAVIKRQPGATTAEYMAAGRLARNMAMLHPLTINGDIHADSLKIQREKTIYRGHLKALNLFLSGQFDLYQTGILEVSERVESNGHFVNYGGEMDTKGVFIQRNNPLQIESGTWFHEGEVDVISGGFLNKGSLMWKNVLFKGYPHKQCPVVSYELRGECSFDNVTVSDGNFKFCNLGDLYLKNQPSNFMKILANQGRVILSSGQYIAKNITGRVSLIENEFTITDNPLNPAPNRILVTESESLPQIQSDKVLKLELQKNLPPLLEQIAQVQTPALMAKLYGGAIPKDYVFENLNFINLCINGNLSIPFEVKIRSGCFDIDGILSLGTSNDKMGTLVATEGPLTVRAHEMDARFGKIYGFGPTTISSTTGEITIGAPLVGGSFRHMKNGSFLRSNNTLDVNSASKLNIHYSKVSSIKKQTLCSKIGITNIASDILSHDDVWVDAPSYNHTRDAVNITTYDHVKVDSPYCLTFGYFRVESSDQAIMHSLGNIYFQVDKGQCLASTILAKKNIFYKPYSHQSSAFKESRPSSFLAEARNNLRVYTIMGFLGPTEGSHTEVLSPNDAIILAGQKIEIATDTLNLSAIVNAGGHMGVKTTGTTTFLNPSRTRRTIMPTGPIVVDLTQMIQDRAQGDGFFKKLANGDVISEFPFGTPSTPQPNQILYLTDSHTPDQMALQKDCIQCHQTQSVINPPLRFFNPLNTLNLDSWIQLAFATHAGRVGNTDYHTAMNASGNWIQKYNRNTITPDDIKNITGALLLCKLQEVVGGLQETLKLVIGPDEINPYQSAGDITGQSFTCETEGQQTHLNNRIVMEEDLTLISKRNLTIQDADILAKKKLDVYADKNLLVESTVQTYHHDNGTYQVVEHPTSLTCTDGPARVVGREGFQMRGASLEAGEEITVGSTEGPSTITDVQLVRTDEITHSEDGGWFGPDKTTTETRKVVTSHPSTITSQKKTVTFLSGKDEGTTLLGSHVSANQSIVFKGGKTTIGASVGENTVSSETTAEGLFSSSHSIFRQSVPVFFPSSLQTPLIQFLTEGKPVAITGSDIFSRVFDASLAGPVSCSPTVGRMRYFQQSTGRSPLAHYDIGCSGYEDIARPTYIQTNKFILNLNPAFKHIMTSVDWNPKLIEIIGKYIEEKIHLDRQHQDWHYDHPAISQELKIVVALAMASISGGAAASLGAALCGSGTMSAGMLAAAFKAVCIQAATNFAGHGDPLRTAGYLVSKEGTRAILSSTVKESLVGGGGYDASQGFSLNVALNTGRAVVGVAVDETVGGQKVNGETFKKAVLQAGLETGTGYMAHNIGALPKHTQENQFLNHGAHSATAALSKGASNLITGERFEKNMAAASFGAVTVQMIAQGLTDEKAIRAAIRSDADKQGKTLTLGQENALYLKEIQRIADLSKICAASLGVVTGLDVSSIVSGASPVLEQDFMANHKRQALEWQMLKEKAEDMPQVNITPKKETKEKVISKKSRSKKAAPSRGSKNKALSAAEEDIALDMTVERILESSPQKVFEKKLFEFVTEMAFEEKQEQMEKPQASKPRMITIMAPGSEYIYPVPEEITFEEAKVRLNKGIDAGAWIPNPFGTVCLAAGLGRDLYQGKTVGEVLFDAALAYSFLKGIKWTGKGVKFIYQKGKAFVQTNMSNTLSALVRNEQGAGKGFGKTTAFFKTRPLLPEDIAKDIGNLFVKGTIGGDGEKIFVKLYWVRNTSLSDADIVTNMMHNNWRLNKPKEPLSTDFVATMMNQLMRKAKEMGATTLQFEALTTNPRLSAILSKRYNGVDGFGKSLNKDVQDLFITIPLTSPKVPQTLNLKGEAKTTNKISSFIRDESGAGKGVVSGVLILGKKAIEGGKYVW